jgi:beta-lactamase class D
MRPGQLISLTVACVLALSFGSAPALAQKTETPRGQNQKKNEFHVWNAAFQTQTLAKLALLVNNKNIPALKPKPLKAFQESLRYANQEVSYVVKGTLTDAEKTLKIKALQQGVLKLLQKTLAPKDLEALVLKADALSKSELITQIKASHLFPLDDPWGFIGETEKNLLKTDALGGNTTLAELAQGTFSPDFRPKR